MVLAAWCGKKKSMISKGSGALESHRNIEEWGYYAGRKIIKRKGISGSQCAACRFTKPRSTLIELLIKLSLIESILNLIEN